jgi:hypothetical protein
MPQAAQPAKRLTWEQSASDITFYYTNPTNQPICVTVTFNEEKSYNVVGSTVGTITVDAFAQGVYIARYRRDVYEQTWRANVNTHSEAGACE